MPACVYAELTNIFHVLMFHRFKYSRFAIVPAPCAEGVGRSGRLIRPVDGGRVWWRLYSGGALNCFSVIGYGVRHNFDGQCRMGHLFY